MEETVFAKIIRREIPAEIVYENDDVIAFLDIKPDSPGHTLVVPKTYARNIFDIDEKIWGSLTEAVRTLSAAIKKAVGADGIRIAMNNEPEAGQVIFHAHIHIVPHFTKTPKFSREEIVQKIKSAL